MLAITFTLATMSCQLMAGDAPCQVDRTQAAYRMPLGLVWQQDRLFAANARTGTVSMIDVNAGGVLAEWKVADSLSAMTAWQDGFLVLDNHEHRILHLVPHPESGELQIAATTDIAKFPVDVAVNEDQSVIAVSSLWSHQLTILNGDDPQLAVQTRIELPFAPRTLLFVTNKQLIVADAFGGKLAIVDCTSGQIVSQHSVYGHNISGLSLNHDATQLLVTCQTLDAGTFTSYERIFWGVVMQNGLQAMPLTSLLSQGAQISDTVIEEPNYDGSSYASQNRYPLGTPSNGSGDPGELVVTKHDTTLLLLSGVNQLAFRTASHLPFERLKTGRRPEAICLDREQQRAFVANRFDDSITVISLKGESPTVESTILLGKARELTLAEQGEQTFYDATVSLDGWFSCHSCHTDGHTNGLRADTFGDEDRGAPKKIASLLGTHDTGPWAWNGSKVSLEEQIRTSLIISMQTQLTSDNLPITPLAAYLKTLQPPLSKHAAQDKVPAKAQLEMAEQEFVSAGCGNCHSGNSFTSDGRYDVGVHDETGERLFNPPSLRGVSQRAPYFHDGRAATLTDVLKSAHHGPENPLVDGQIERLLLLLETL
jgi:hypothetical protein